jgi:hypothetical protein
MAAFLSGDSRKRKDREIAFCAFGPPTAGPSANLHIQPGQESRPQTQGQVFDDIRALFERSNYVPPYTRTVLMPTNEPWRLSQLCPASLMILMWVGAVVNFEYDPQSASLRLKTT